jgi:DNA transformation protein
MPISPEYRAFLTELFAPIGPVHIRNMFGGAGVFRDDLMFALIASETLYLKVDQTNRADFAAEGAEQFTYASPSGKIVEFGYFQLPERLLDEPDEFAEWARKALDVARRAERAKAPKRAGATKLPKRKRVR